MTEGIVTEKHDLRTGDSIWLRQAGISARSGSDVPTRADVVIVGAGISGAMLAYRLRRRGTNVIVLDRRGALQGSTAASTALVQFEIDTPLVELSRMIGQRSAERAWRRSAAAVVKLRDLVRRERIRCGWRESNSLYVAGDAYGHRALHAEAEARAAAGVPGDYLKGSELMERFGIDRTAAIVSPGAAQADPVQLAAGLFRRAAKKGVNIYAPVAVKAMEADRTGVTLATDDNAEITARHAIFCTGYEVLKSIPDKGHRASSTWALASTPGTDAPAWLDRHLVWEASEPYLYIRRTHDGRIIAGGEDEPYSDTHSNRRLLYEKTEAIAGKLRALLPALRFEIECRWAGAFGESNTGLPFVGAVPGYPSCYAVMGFGGNGITYAVIAADIVSALIAGKQAPDADLYRFQ
jgi:glycine/D-amino acid oxidase-like deaminating enzyme